MGLDAMILVFWILSFKPSFSLSSFTFIKRFFSSSLLYAISVVSSAYLRLLIFLPAILIPPGASSSPAFLMMYSAYESNKQGDNIQPWHTSFPIWNQSVVLDFIKKYWNDYTVFVLWSGVGSKEEACWNHSKNLWLQGKNQEKKSVSYPG